MAGGPAIVPPERVSTDTSPLSPSLYVESLYSQRKSPEELLVSATVAGDLRDSLSMESQLTEFTALKRLGVPREFLVEENSSSFYRTVEAFEILPPALQTLQIEFAASFRSPFSRGSTGVPDDLINWLAEVLTLRNLRYPALKKITL